ncbi:MAG: dTDP-glucose 4,6-dehydratase [Nitrospirae bacterium RBG_16_64_22]|nr:MAG: dTDP-glucose 4,6-dehydratase [Nitrospirae bacterium RBG_16_64_22]
MKILVTGGCGFIGSNYVRYVLRERPEDSVINLDAMTYAGNRENLADVETDHRYRFVQGDIADPEAVRPLFEDVDAVVNFAAESHVDRSILGPAIFVRTNVSGTQILLDAARKMGVRRFVQVSTDEVYGSLGPTGLFTEETPLAPNSPYSASKAAADFLVRAYHHTYGFPGIVTRCSNNYGPYQFPEKLIPLFVLRAMNDQPVPVYGDGLNVRDWIYVDDHCAAVDLVLRKGEPGGVYNIGANSERTNLDVTRTVLRRLGKPESLIQFVPDRPGHDRRYAIDSSRIERDLGWRPRVGFEEGIERTIEWYGRNRAWLSNLASRGVGEPVRW